MSNDTGMTELAIKAGVIGALIVAALPVSGCSGSMSAWDQHTSSTHDFLLAGSKDAIQVHYDAMLASAKQMVEPADKNFHTERRILQEKEYTIQNESGKTWWQRISAKARAELNPDGGK